jgi:hypothetical protein
MFWSPLLRFIDDVRRHLPIALARHVVDRVAAEAGVDRSLGLVEGHSRFAVNTSPAYFWILFLMNLLRSEQQSELKAELS